MADPALQTLLSSKAALDLGLITHEDYEIVKSSFLKAQQLKAAVDVGVLKGDDYERTKEQFLQLIAAAPAGSAVPSAPVAAPPRATAPPPAALASPAAPAPGPPRPAPVTVPVAVAPTPAPNPSRPSSRPPSRPQTPSTNGVASPTKPVQQDVPISLPRIGGVRKASGVRRSRRGFAIPNSLPGALRSGKGCRACMIANTSIGSILVGTCVPSFLNADFHERHCCVRGRRQPVLSHPLQVCGKDR